MLINIINLWVTGQEVENIQYYYSFCQKEVIIREENAGKR
jgi:hypothetical protein